jgi:hypothetical protein
MNNTQIKVTCFYDETGKDFSELIETAFLLFLKSEMASIKN